MDKKPVVDVNLSGYLMKEQLQLTKAQRQLDQMIKTINTCLNELVVENLQLNANEVNYDVDFTAEKNQVSAKVPSEPDTKEEINQQSLNLIVTGKNKMYVDEESDDEDVEL